MSLMTQSIHADKAWVRMDTLSHTTRHVVLSRLHREVVEIHLANSVDHALLSLVDRFVAEFVNAQQIEVYIE